MKPFYKKTWIGKWEHEYSMDQMGVNIAGYPVGGRSYVFFRVPKEEIKQLGLEILREEGELDGLETT